MSFAFVFPGQGSQSVGMLAALAGSDEVRGAFAEASAVLGFDLWALTQAGPESLLNATENTQPAMLCAGVAVWRLWRGRGGAEPLAMAGHSLGEFTALVCAGALDFGAAVDLVRFRGRIMQEAVPSGTGAMAAILGLEDAQVIEACRAAAAGAVVEAVNFNAPGQVVIAGERAAVGRALEAARRLGARRAVELAVSVPSHSSLMRPAVERFARKLEGIVLSAPRIPCVSAVDAEVHSDAADLRGLLARQLASPVRWRDTVRALAARGIGQLIECGPGKVLTGLNRRIERPAGLECLSVEDEPSVAAARAVVGSGGGTHART
ncbi:MAG TPA: ACP S-malonyltransferase [Steroidobacteraceae bacterium]|nr:ACP S-malonyltransferase [Steroidobacteraceae bacterium]